MPQTDSLAADRVVETKQQNWIVSTYFEIGFPQIADQALAEALCVEFEQTVDAIAPLAVRDGWLNQPYTGEMSVEKAHELAEKCLAQANQGFEVSPTSADEWYCIVSNQLVCYPGFQIEHAGEIVDCTGTASGRQVTSPIKLTVKFVPA